MAKKNPLTLELKKIHMVLVRLLGDVSVSYTCHSYLAKDVSSEGILKLLHYEAKHCKTCDVQCTRMGHSHRDIATKVFTLKSFLLRTFKKHFTSFHRRTPYRIADVVISPRTKHQVLNQTTKVIARLLMRPWSPSPASRFPPFARYFTDSLKLVTIWPLHKANLNRFPWKPSRKHVPGLPRFI